ncbi:DNA-binding domain-containing protein [Levilactobacillus tujiorum]|uniref:DNA-binding domain-containing protein n=1 Tax=Levilactobacillus tujiorum TaxID=2912243 RepID=UPI001456CC97|nr:DNA-binding domain-containing protein [Levilactobacillus tujiorum]NLR31591.1 response regulator [Levilactobacillus tujiorum]
MNFYIVDDDPAIPMMLRRILEQDSANSVVGTAAAAPQAMADMMRLDVDIVLVDLLMPGMSGTELVGKMKALHPELRFIMISQVKDADLRAEAYQAGIEFFIDKPINLIEVKTVVEKVAQSVQMATKLNDIQSLIGGGITPTPTVDPHQEQKEKILSILRFLGITSEAGSADILAITQIMIDHQLSFREIDFNAAYHIDDREKKIVFQRVRRAIKTGLTNLAHLCLDDMGDEIVVEYANTLYEYKNVRSEMLYLEGERSTRGKTSLKRFFDGLVQEV